MLVSTLLYYLVSSCGWLDLYSWPTVSSRCMSLQRHMVAIKHLHDSLLVDMLNGSRVTV